MDNVGREVGLVVVDEWRALANDLAVKHRPALEILTPKEETEAYKKYLEDNRLKISQMLTSRADECEKFCAEASGFCVLGL